ncbi:hypothetical protein JCGZ_16049 [Jatropha curcas]|uniref:ACB domain-containing protein n=1 Tax=Jatropha curcas TaxID=180498 RepID=A0A067KZN3_JATCU|nr:acyl-CoA-binding domain-containing protein 3 [Jatropha curcas]KDP41642.1 hypothetical protein JCGZ_16049 [Jatropha curcas]
MELLQELFVTAFVAVVCSFLIAKIVSIAMAGGDSSNASQLSKSQNDDQKITGDDGDERVMEDLRYFEKLKVEGYTSEKRVEFVQEGAQKVDGFVGGSIEAAEVEKSVNRDEVIETECRELVTISVEEGLKEEDKSSEDMLGKCEGEFQVNRHVGVELADGKGAIDEKQRGVDDNLLKENIEIESVGIESSVKKDAVEESEEIRVVGSETIEKGEEKKIEIDSDDDDWEGIERSELDHVFAKAVNLVESADKDGGSRSIGSDVQMELYGLHKVATEGPCREQPPLPLKVAARAKWNAWQRLGNMNPEVAMEQYVALVSDKVPGWMEGKSADDDKPGSSAAANPGAVASDLSTTSSHHQNITEERNPEVMLGIEKNDYIGPNVEDKVKE